MRRWSSGCTRPTSRSPAICASSPATSKATRSAPGSRRCLSDAFYWTDNDLVVQTRSMYGGAPRAKDATFVLDQGGKVSHFNYFSNPRTARAIVNALALSADPPDDSASSARCRGRGVVDGRSGGTAIARRGRGRRAAGGVRAARHPRQQPEGRQRSHLARLAPRQRPRAARLRPEGRPMSSRTARSACTTTTSRRSSSTTTT